MEMETSLCVVYVLCIHAIPLNGIANQASQCGQGGQGHPFALYFNRARDKNASFS